MKRCVFCKANLADVGKSREHIIPAWLQREWKIEKHLVEPTHFDESLKVISQRKHTFDDFLAGGICPECNSGWMSKLEVDCKSLILGLSAGRKQIMDLRDDEALLLARWTVKTAFALHMSANWRRIVPEDHICKLDSESYRLPENVYVVGHTFNRGSRIFSWSQSTTWEINAKNYTVTKGDLEVLRLKGYKIALRLGGLFLMVFHNPWPFAVPCLWKYRHIPLYPRWSCPVFWRVDDEKTWTNKADFRFKIFEAMLGLAIELKEDSSDTI